jgi:hypothetical protein
MIKAAILTAAAPLALAAALAGCGGSGGPPDLSKFIGTWTVVSGLLATHCSNDFQQSIPITQPTTFIAGSTSHLVDSDAVCPIRYDVSGAVAEALPGQSCMNPDVISKLNILHASFTTTDGVTATYGARGGQDQYNDITAGSPVRCIWAETATYQRSAP